jgi:CheY-like chemotaxis protein
LIKPVKPADLKSALLQIPGAGSAHGHKAHTGAKRILPPASRSLRVLLAEDNPVNQHLAVRMLRRQGHSVEIANNGQEAVEAFDSKPFDLILMDVQMPGMSGLEAAAAIRERESRTGCRIPIIAMTAYAMKGDRERCLEAGMDDYVSKPVRAEELFRAIESAIICDAAKETI